MNRPLRGTALCPENTRHGRSRHPSGYTFRPDLIGEFEPSGLRPLAEVIVADRAVPPSVVIQYHCFIASLQPAGELATRLRAQGPPASPRWSRQPGGPSARISNSSYRPASGKTARVSRGAARQPLTPVQSVYGPGVWEAFSAASRAASSPVLIAAPATVRMTIKTTMAIMIPMMLQMRPTFAFPAPMPVTLAFFEPKMLRINPTMPHASEAQMKHQIQLVATQIMPRIIPARASPFFPGVAAPGPAGACGGSCGAGVCGVSVMSFLL